MCYFASISHSPPSSPRTVHLRSRVEPPLRPHPRQTRTGYNQRPQKPAPRLRSPKHQPLTHKVRQRHAVRRHRQIVHGALRDEVRAVDPDDGREEGPCTEEPAGVWCGARAGVELARVGRRGVGLGCV